MMIKRFLLITLALWGLSSGAGQLLSKKIDANTDAKPYRLFEVLNALNKNVNWRIYNSGEAIYLNATNGQRTITCNITENILPNGRKNIDIEYYGDNINSRERMDMAVCILSFYKNKDLEDIELIDITISQGENFKFDQGFLEAFNPG